jgi:hypothetical protein
MFWFKRKKIIVDCFTYRQSVFDLYKIRKAIHFYPDYIKKMEPDVQIQDHATNVKVKIPTIKKCYGINTLYKHGAIIPFWIDYVCSPKTAVDGTSKLGVSDHWNLKLINSHARSQYEGLLDNWIHLKFDGVWNIQEKTGVQFLWTAPFWNINNNVENYLVPPGITFYDWQCQTNLNMFVKRDAEPFTILAGTPMIHLIPLTDNEVEYKCHLVSEREHFSKNSIPLDFPQITNGLRNNRWKKDKAAADKMDADEKKSKCPFGFGR